ncbi:MAG: 2-phospho-L-lactate transferase CofD family protein, partial [Candidatus Velthaea sp.]
MVAGLLLIALGIWRWLNSIVSAMTPHGSGLMLEALLETRLKHGYKIVTIGGGTGLATLLRGLKRHTSNLTAVV